MPSFCWILELLGATHQFINGQPQNSIANCEIHKQPQVKLTLTLDSDMNNYYSAISGLWLFWENNVVFFNFLIKMGFLTILKKLRQKEKEMRILMLYPFWIYLHSFRKKKNCYDSRLLYFLHVLAKLVIFQFISDGFLSVLYTEDSTMPVKRRFSNVLTGSLLTRSPQL